MAAFGLLSFQPSATQATIVVNEWLLGTGLSDPGNSQYPSASFSNVQNPFQNSHSVALGSSYATTRYDYAWTGDSAHFDAYPLHHLEQLDGDTGSSARIHLTPTVDSILTLEGTWNYGWPSATLGEADIVVDAFDLETEEEIAWSYASGGNLFFGSPSGTLTVQDSALLLAGRKYEIYYLARVYHSNPTPPGTYGEASGEIQFSIVPIPEPAALSLILPALLLPRRRKR
jgi:hypothetical protein